MLSEPAAVTLRVVGVLDSLGIPYLISGSFASAIHGIARAAALDIGDLLERALHEASAT